MEVTGFGISITSEQPEALTEWYRDTLELPVNEEMGGGAFNVGGAQLIIDGHSETTGPTKEPQRVLINMLVDDLGAEHQRLLAKGVTFIRDPERDLHGLFATFLDPDGNYLQLVEFTPGAYAPGDGAAAAAPPGDA